MQAKSTRLGAGQAAGERFWLRVHKTDGCWEWQGARDENGYGRVHFTHNRPRAQRVAWERTYGPIPNGMFVLHRCDNPPCVRPDHLFLGTQLDNIADMVAKGRNGRAGDRGGRAGNPKAAKVTPAQVADIRRRRLVEGTLTRQLAEEYHLSKSQILRIINGERWSHLT